MAKESFYFSHDYNARTDDKIKQLLRKHNMLGYGVFWAIIEDLYNNANALRLDCEGIAFDLRVHSDIVHSVLHDFDLFVFKDGYFGSLSVQKRIDDRNLKSKKASISAAHRWDKSKNNANALRTHSERNAIKERKGKERKVDEEEKSDNIDRSDSPFSVGNQFFEFMTTNSIAKEELAMQFYTSKTNIEKACIGFQIHLAQSGVQPQEIKMDYKSHFKSWVQKRGKDAWETVDTKRENEIREQIKRKLNATNTAVA